MRSDVDDQTNRPAMLNKESRPTKPPAAATVTAEVVPVRKKSWIIGLACSRMPMPAVTLQNRTIHRSQNDRVRIALAADTWPAVTRDRVAAAAVQPSGRQSGGGTRTLTTPNSITTKYPMPSVTNSSTSARPEATELATDEW